MPPGTMTTSADSQRFDNQVLAAVAAPVVLFVWTYFAYAIVNFRHRGGELVDGPPLRSHPRIITIWMVVTSAIVMFAFIFGTYELIAPAGAGTGEGASPIWNPSTKKPLEVQVIAQQWRFTYRWPQYGGVETFSLNLPVGKEVKFDVTSLDVIHDFWAYELGVKADANPGTNNVAYTKPLHTGSIQIRCDELCGIWHGAMAAVGHVVSTTSFTSWIHQQQTANAPITKLLPKFAYSYTPDDFGADGGYYDPSVDPFSTKYP
jgi:cytochrome c oxidase subunit 2